MSKKEASRPLRGQAEGQSLDNLSVNQYITKRGNGQFIYDVLPQGEANAIASAVLADMIGVKTVRELQHRVAAEREQGALILSASTGGYFKPASGEQGQEEIARFVATLRSRAINTFKALKTARAALSKAEGQLTLDELEGL